MSFHLIKQTSKAKQDRTSLVNNKYRFKYLLLAYMVGVSTHSKSELSGWISGASWMTQHVGYRHVITLSV